MEALCSAQREDGGFNYALRVNPEDPYSVDGSVDTTGPVLAALLALVAPRPALAEGAQKDRTLEEYRAHLKA